MRVYCGTLFAIALALANAGLLAESKTNGANLSHWLRSLEVADQQEAFTRWLRSSTSPRGGNGEEERGIGIHMIDDFFANVKLNSKLHSWMESRTKADDAYTLLALDKAGDNVLESPGWKTWTRYVSMITKDDVDGDVVAALTRRYGPDGVSKMLASAAENPNTKAIASKLEAAQLKEWISHDWDPQEIFKVLKLDEAGQDLFDSPVLTTWTNYLEAFNKKNPKRHTTILEGLTAGYGKQRFLEILAAADDIVGATKFKDQVVEGWLQDGIHLTHLFKSLRLDVAGNDLLSSPLLSMWVQYMKAFNKGYSSSATTMIQTFTKSYGEEKLATILQAATEVPATKQFVKNLQKAQFKQWMIEKKTPDDIYKNILKVESTDSPSADIWRAYYKAYVKEFPGELFSFKLHM